MSFNPIETQEELDSIIKERITRERNKIVNEYTEKYKDYDEIKNSLSSYVDNEAKQKELLETLTNENNSLKSQLSEASSKMSEYETNSAKKDIAHEFGLPYEMYSRIQGSTPEEMRKDAESLKKLMGIQRVAPSYTGSEKQGSSRDEEFKKLLNQIKGD